MTKRSKTNERDSIRDLYLNNNDEKFLQDFEMITERPDIAAVVSYNKSFDDGVELANPSTQGLYPTKYAIYDNILANGNFVPDLLLEGMKDGVFNNPEYSSYEIACMLDVNLRRAINMVNEEYSRMKYSLDISTILNAGGLIMTAMRKISSIDNFEFSDSDAQYIADCTGSVIRKYFDTFTDRSIKDKEYGFYYRNLKLVTIDKDKDSKPYLGDDKYFLSRTNDMMFNTAADVDFMYNIVYAISNTTLASILFTEEADTYSVLSKVMGYLDGCGLFTDYANSLIQLASYYHQKSYDLQNSERFKSASKKVRLFEHMSNNEDDVDF